MINHTPGPWVHRPEKYDDWGLVRAADGMPVASANVSARHPDVMPEPIDGLFPEPPEIAANALLISAAPAFYREATRIIERHDSDAKAESLDRCRCRDCHGLRFIIAKMTLAEKYGRSFVM